MKINLVHHGVLLQKITDEINRGNEKHGSGRIATPVEVVAILTEELGEYSQAILQERWHDAEKELIQVVAVAINYLTGYGPHFTNK